MRRHLLIITYLLIGFVSQLQAQTYGNEWIDYTQEHYKISVGADGIYRIPLSTLTANSLGSISPTDFIMWHNGQIVPIFVSTTNGAIDFIEFFGKKNIGDVDSTLYANDSLQPHIYYSLFTDTSIYYLTVNTTGAGGPLRFFTPKTNDLLNAPNPEPYFMCVNRQLNTGLNIQGQQYYAGTDQAFKSTFDWGEGYGNSQWFGSFAATGQVTSQTFTFQTPFLYQQGAPATFKAVYENYSPGYHLVDVQLNNNAPYTQGSNGFFLNKLNVSVPIGQLQPGSSSVTFSTQDGSTQSVQQNNVFLTELDYPSLFNFNNQNTFFFTINGNQSSTQHLQISNFNSNGSQPILFDLSNGLRIQSNQPATNSVFDFVLPASGTASRDLYLISGFPTSVNIVQQMAPVFFKNYTNLNADYFLIYNTQLDSNNDVTNYQHYRDNNGTPYIGKFYTALIDIDQLYDQFGYGVKKSPLSIRNFIQYALHKYATGAWTHKPQYAFIIGKGYQYPDMRNGGNSYNNCLVPTFGQPGSDNLLAAARFSDTSTISIGRLAARTGQQVHDYLAKMQAYESFHDTTSTGDGALNGYPADEAIAPKLWQKQVLEFSGGTGAQEQSQFASFVQSFGSVAVDSSWGANITYYAKTGSDPIATSQANVIKNQIDSGASLLTFFGHSATGAFDFSIDEPENYTNHNRYPVILSNGCFAGDIFETTAGYSERFVLEANIGAIAFMATSDLSVNYSLYNFSYALYQNFCKQYYMNSYGFAVRQAVKNIITNYANDPFSLMACYEFTLHGDPALRLNIYQRPDYAIDNSSVYFTPSTVTQSNNTFQVNVIVTNLGKAIKDSINVSLKRVVYDANNNQVVFNSVKRILAPYYKDTVSFTVTTLSANIGTGQNLFYPYVDAGFEVKEMAEDNNGLALNPKSLFIQQDDVLPIYPYEYAIDSSAAVILKASTTNPFAALRTYDFEIDTSQLFNPATMGNGFHQKGTVTQVGGVLHWAPPGEVYKDSMVYYWRVKMDTSANNWHYTSFEHIKGQFGWNQSHFFQYRQDNYLNMYLDSPTRTFKFNSNTNNISVVTGFADAEGGNLPYATLGWYYNNYNEYRFRMGGCEPAGGATITIAVISGTTGLPLMSYNAGDGSSSWGTVYGNYHCFDHADPQAGFDFSTSGQTNYTSGPFQGKYWDTLIYNFINSIPYGDYVLMYSDNRVNYSTWPGDPELMAAFAEIGFNPSPLVSVPGPFIYFTQKTPGNNYPNTVFKQSNSFYTPVRDSFNFTGAWHQGQMLSPLIGPAKGWNDMQWRRHALESQSRDVDSVDIIGYNNNGASTVLRTTVTNDNPITFINPAQYPYLQLRLRTSDDSTHTPTQLNYWRILYQEVPEAAINPAAHYLLTSDTVSQGGNLNVEVGIENVTNIKMDSMLVYYTIRDAQSHSTLDSVTFSPLPGLSVLNLKYNKPLTSSSIVGLDHLTIEANPHNKQPEQYHFNNFAQLDFHGTSNTTNPLLDVTFDGSHIFNGDIISAKPNIVISLRSDSKYQPLKDTTSMNVYLLSPGQTTPVRINYDGQILKFYAADTSNLIKLKRAQDVYTPNFTQDGTYQIMVQDIDPNGNHSSNVNRYEGNTFYDYKMSFQVINKPMITNVLNYPNPFSTSTKFIFTLTGSEIPQYMKIQIMTIKGIVVREITEQELGPIHIGTNISDYAWDGRDQYGSKLANGVYFYHVVTRLDNKNMDGMGMSYDNFFKKGFGKMVILR